MPKRRTDIDDVRRRLRKNEKLPEADFLLVAHLAWHHMDSKRTREIAHELLRQPMFRKSMH